MQTSRLYLGQPAQFETALRSESPCNLDDLHWFAQRVCQYARNPQLDTTRLRQLIPRFGKRVSKHFLGQLTLAMALRALGDDQRANDAWQHAIELTPTNHPWAHVVPSAARWAGAAPFAELVEEEPGRVYRLIGETRADGAAFGTRGVGRFLRLESGKFVLVNPVPISAKIAAEVRELGEVSHIIAPAKYHSEHVMAARRAFPTAQVWGVPGHRNYPRVANIQFDGFLDDDSPLFPGEIDQVTLHGNDIGDVWLLDHASSTLITTDALFYAEASPDEGYSTGFSTFYAWAWGVCARNGVPSYQPPMWRDLPRYQDALRKAFALPFEHVAYSHGSWRVMATQGNQRIRDALSWILQLSKWDGLRLTFDFLRRHPRVVYRALRDGGA